MIRYNRPTRIDLKKSDLEEYEKKKQEEELTRQAMDDQSAAHHMDYGDQDQASPLQQDAQRKRAEIRRRLGFSPSFVASDGNSGIHI